MNCFYHNNRPAVGICKACGKGICTECTVDLGKGIACNGSCEEEVKSLITLIERNKSSHQKTGFAYKRNALVMSLLGALFMILGSWGYLTYESNWLIAYMIPAGFIFLISAFLNLRSSKQITQINED